MRDIQRKNAEEVLRATAETIRLSNMSMTSVAYLLVKTDDAIKRTERILYDGQKDIPLNGHRSSEQTASG